MISKVNLLCKKIFLRFKSEGFFGLIRYIMQVLKARLKTHLVLNFPPSLLTTQVSFIHGLKEGDKQAVAAAKNLLSPDLKDPKDISDKYVCLYVKNHNFSKERAVVVAHWDPEQLVDPYVVHICKAFKALGHKVVLSSAQPLKHSSELEQWQQWADAIVYRTCDGYDFTSWKAALDCFPSLYECRQLTLTNDSYFGPIGSFKAVYDKMSGIESDFWGLTYSEDIAPHLQSYFLVFNQKALQSTAFKQFISFICHENNRTKAITYETSLGLYLTMHGLQGAVYAAARLEFYKKLNLAFYHYDKIIDFGVPILKRDTLKNNEKCMTTFFNSSSRYGANNIKFVHDYFKRVGS